MNPETQLILAEAFALLPLRPDELANAAQKRLQGKAKGTTALAELDRACNPGASHRSSRPLTVVPPDHPDPAARSAAAPSSAAGKRRSWTWMSPVSFGHPQ